MGGNAGPLEGPAATSHPPRPPRALLATGSSWSHPHSPPLLSSPGTPEGLGLGDRLTKGSAPSQSQKRALGHLTACRAVSVLFGREVFTAAREHKMRQGHAEDDRGHRVQESCASPWQCPADITGRQKSRRGDTGGPGQGFAARLAAGLVRVWGLVAWQVRTRGEGDRSLSEGELGSLWGTQSS